MCSLRVCGSGTTRRGNKARHSGYMSGQWRWVEDGCAPDFPATSTFPPEGAPTRHAWAPGARRTTTLTETQGVWP